MLRLIQFSDTHLREGQWRHQRNFSRAVRRAGGYDLAVISGDLSVDGADQERDLIAARERFSALRGPLHLLPGNHDVGEEPASPRQRQPVSPKRLERYTRILGHDHFDIALPGWRLIGLNVHVFGTAWPEEARQWALLEEAVAGSDTARVGVFLHKPLFLVAPDEPADLMNCVDPAARERLLALADGGSGIAFFSSGHLHQTLLRKVDGVLHAWCPATANPANTMRAPGAIGALGFLEWQLGADRKYRVRMLGL